MKPRIATDYTDGHGCFYFVRAHLSHPCASVFYSLKNLREPCASAVK